MTLLTNESLLRLNAIGLIPGPKESPDAFAKRADYCLDLPAHLSEELKTLLSGNGIPNTEILSPATAKLSVLYDCAPDWIPMFFTNHRLPLWQGGCAWIFQIAESSPVASLVQLRKRFAVQKTYLGLYDRDELLRHELCHAGRMMYQEPKYEEIIAYRTADSKFRRYLGPLVQSSMESAIFLLLLFAIVVFDIFIIAAGRTEAYPLSLWLKGIPLLLIAAAGGRLWSRQKTFDHCLKNVAKAVGTERASHLTYRLTDEEIERFAKATPQEIKEYALDKKGNELRWQVLYKAYFNP